MKVLLVNGSPHEKGCTHEALNEVRNALEQEGIHADFFWIGDQPIAGCCGCGGCAKAGKCRYDDRVNAFLEIAGSYDGFVFGAPVHFASAAASMTAFLDRAFFTDHCAGRNLFAFKPACLQKVQTQLVRHLLRSRAFEAARVRGRYWQILIDGTQLYRSRNSLDERSLYCIHNKGTANEYRENYYYVLEAKLVLHSEMIVSLLSEFVENEEGGEAEKQDCERKACWRLMERLKEEFPRLPICLSADSLYACKGWFQRCEQSHWKYILRFKEGSIPSIGEEYQSLKGCQKNRRENKEDGWWYDFVTGVEYEGNKLQVLEYEPKRASKEAPAFLFLTNLPLQHTNAQETAELGRRRWKMENEGFNTQKRQGYNLEHPYSKDYEALKNHYYLIQIGHMIASWIFP